MWKLQPEADYVRRARNWPDKHRREFAAVHDNLDTLLKALNNGATIEQIRHGFMHSEPRGIIAIDQKGGGKGLKETRLYTYLNKPPQIIHLITLGDKNSQAADIKYATEFVDSLHS